ncbi:MAG TPA: S8 family serine peptidase [Candidatus Thermoplasmatota archaeon]|nr:S8 family serine peptidase [Candidatus Thermoplasmatota archaeon]
MKLVLTTAVAVLFLLAPVATADLVEVTATTSKTEYIIGFFETPAYTVGDLYYGDRVVAVDTDLNFIVVETLAPALLEARAELDGAVRYIEWNNPNYAVINYVPNDPRYTDSSHYGPKIIGAETAWDKTLGTTAIKVGVLDTGINRNHEDFVGGRVLQGYDFYNGDNDPNDQGGWCSYHGSHTAGTIGATTGNAKGMAGMAQVQILPVKAFGGGLCGGSTTALVNGLKYIADQGSHVSSNSWGSSSASTALNDALTYAHNKGTIHVAAAGNSGSCTNCVSYPWKSKPAITIVVSATDSKDAFASFSSEGPEVDVAAPGVSTLSVDGGTTTGYKTMSGTSMACPHVAGVAALIKTLNPSMSFSSLEGRLQSTAKDLGASGKDDKFGYGRVNAAAAVY